VLIAHNLLAREDGELSTNIRFAHLGTVGWSASCIATYLQKLPQSGSPIDMAVRQEYRLGRLAIARMLPIIRA